MTRQLATQNSYLSLSSYVSMCIYVYMCNCISVCDRVYECITRRTRAYTCIRYNGRACCTFNMKECTPWLYLFFFFLLFVCAHLFRNVFVRCILLQQIQQQDWFHGWIWSGHREKYTRTSTQKTCHQKLLWQTSVSIFTSSSLFLTAPSVYKIIQQRYINSAGKICKHVWQYCSCTTTCYKDAIYIRILSLLHRIIFHCTNSLSTKSPIAPSRMSS